MGAHTSLTMRQLLIKLHPSKFMLFLQMQYIKKESEFPTLLKKKQKHLCRAPKRPNLKNVLSSTPDRIGASGLKTGYQINDYLKELYNSTTQLYSFMFIINIIFTFFFCNFRNLSMVLFLSNSLISTFIYGNLNSIH